MPQRPEGFFLAAGIFGIAVIYSAGFAISPTFTEDTIMNLYRQTRMLLPMLFFCLYASSANASPMKPMAAGGNSGTATEYFSRLMAVGNTWTYLHRATCTGMYCIPQTSYTQVNTVTGLSGGVATNQSTVSGIYGSTATSTSQIDASGAWISTSSDSYGAHATTALPASFSVGTTWTDTQISEGITVTTTNTIAAMNVTRTVPAGTFTDCLQIDQVISPTEYAGIYTIMHGSVYFSPTAGWVEIIITTESSMSGQSVMALTWTGQLQSYSVANASPPNYTLNVTVPAIEFYNAGINHYFMTASTDEATVLDNKPEWSWVRTGKTFNIWQSQSAAPSNASPVCRFFGVFANGTVGSHFYTVDATECDMVKGRLDWGWDYENDAFYAVKPTGSTCPSGTSPVYRVYNNGMGGAPNHRYVATQAEIDTMVAQGWVSEGTAFCGVQ